MCRARWGLWAMRAEACATHRAGRQHSKRRARPQGAARPARDARTPCAGAWQRRAAALDVLCHEPRNLLRHPWRARPGRRQSRATRRAGLCGAPAAVWWPIHSASSPRARTRAPTARRLRAVTRSLPASTPATSKACAPASPL